MIRLIPTPVAGVSLAALVLAACATGPDYKPPAAPAAGQGAFLGGANLAFAQGETADSWWRLYEDPVLDRLVQQALGANANLAVATANLAKARAVLRLARNDRLPQTNIGASAIYGRLPAGQRLPGAEREDWAIDTGLDVAYEVDLAGRVRRGVEASRGDFAAAQAARDVVKVAVVAETTRAYLDINSTSERLAVAQRTVELVDQTVTLTQKRLDAGRASRLDVVRAISLRDQRRATLGPLIAARDAARFRLATLTGVTPADLATDVIARGTTPRLAQPIPIGDGAGLLARRPDVRQAERRLAADTARIGVATAELYPTISLGGSIGSTGNKTGDMFGDEPLRWGIGPLVSWSFPNIAATRARIAGANADADAALASFNGTVLVALQETETALSTYQHELERQVQLQSARDAAAEAATISKARLREGRADFLVVLDAERTLADTEADLAGSNARIATAQVDLFRALGGGWR